MPRDTILVWFGKLNLTKHQLEDLQEERIDKVGQRLIELNTEML